MVNGVVSISWVFIVLVQNAMQIQPSLIKHTQYLLQFSLILRNANEYRICKCIAIQYKHYPFFVDRFRQCQIFDFFILLWFLEDNLYFVKERKGRVKALYLNKIYKHVDQFHRQLSLFINGGPLLLQRQPQINWDISGMNVFSVTINSFRVYLRYLRVCDVH